MKYMKKIRVPSGLSQEARVFYKTIVSDYDLEDHHLKILTLAAQCLDRIAEARVTLKREGCYFCGQMEAAEGAPCDEGRAGQ